MVENASVIEVSVSITLNILSFGMVIETFKELFNSFNAFWAILDLFFPSNLNGSVNMPSVIPPKDFAAFAKILVAPEPNPPPNEAIKITISCPLKRSVIFSFSDSAASFAISGLTPVPNPWVNSLPNQKYLMPDFFFKARISVSAIIKVALSKDLPISETIDPPPPPIPTTLILALKRVSAGKTDWLIFLGFLTTFFFTARFFFATILFFLTILLLNLINGLILFLTCFKLFEKRFIFLFFFFVLIKIFLRVLALFIFFFTRLNNFDFAKITALRYLTGRTVFF